MNSKEIYQAATIAQRFSVANNNAMAAKAAIKNLQSSLFSGFATKEQESALNKALAALECIRASTDFYSTLEFINSESEKSNS